jgi:OmpA-OmpF porin, OOP family
MLKNILLFYCVLIFQCTLAQKTGSLEEKSNEPETPFERGGSLIFKDNFDKDAIGDFPAKWNTNKSGQVKKLNGFDNKFLKIAEGSVVNIELTKALPVNFTAEFDMIVPEDVPIRIASFGFGAKPNTISWLLSPKDGIAFSLQSNTKAYSEGLKFGTQKFSSKDFSLKKLDYKTPLNKIIKIAFAINDKRIRLYIDGVKMVDMPTSFDASFRKNMYFNASTHGAAESKLNYFYISNVVIAESLQDRRSQVLKDLIEKGTASTNAIQFTNNSDKITDESNAIIQEFATALKAYPTMQIKIIGHTDNNGNADKNILLSKKRATAVKNKLVSLGIAATQLLTDGKGATEPIENNETEAGKAANRRVQFIKL